MRYLLALAITAVSLFADVTGKWSGSFVVTVDGETRDQTAVLNLKQDGGKITGTAGPSEEEQMKIRDGSIEGDTIQIEVEGHEDHPPIFLSLTVDGDRMTGEAKSQREDHTMTAKLDLTRQK